MNVRSTAGRSPSRCGDDDRSTPGRDPCRRPRRRARRDGGTHPRRPRGRGDPGRAARTVPDALVAGIRAVDPAGGPAAMAGRILADLGAEVILVEPREGHPLRALPRRFLAWGAGKASVPVAAPA